MKIQTTKNSVVTNLSSIKQNKNNHLSLFTYYIDTTKLKISIQSHWEPIKSPIVLDLFTNISNANIVINFLTHDIH